MIIQRLRQKYRFRTWYKRCLALCFDAFGRLLSRGKPSEFNPQTIRKILLVRLDHLGDVIMTAPAVDAVCTAFPQAQIDYLIAAEAAPLYHEDRRFRNILPFHRHWFIKKKTKFFSRWKEIFSLIRRLRAENYDLAVDFRGDLRSILLLSLSRTGFRLGYGVTGGSPLLSYTEKYSAFSHQILLNLKLLECLGIQGKPVLRPFARTDEEKQKFSGSFESLLPPCHLPRLVIHPGAGYPSKRWPGERYKQVIESLLKARSAQMILIGTDEEKSLLPDLPQDELLVDLRGKTKLRDLLPLLSACQIFLGNDSGPAHIAAAQGLELVILFSGTNDPALWHPWTEKLHLLVHPVPCSPCEAKECPLGHHQCLKEIDTESVLNTIKKILPHYSGQIAEKSR